MLRVPAACQILGGSAGASCNGAGGLSNHGGEPTARHLWPIEQGGRPREKAGVSPVRDAIAAIVDRGWTRAVMVATRGSRGSTTAEHDRRDGGRTPAKPTAEPREREAGVEAAID